MLHCHPKEVETYKASSSFSSGELQLHICVLCSMGEELAGLHTIIIKLLYIETRREKLVLPVWGVSVSIFK